MIYLILAIACSTLISVIMRVSSDKIKGNVSMLAMNYLMCVVVAALYTGLDQLFPQVAALPQTLTMGAVHGILYLSSFVLFQHNVRKNGMVLSATFMKLGLLVPIVLSVILFGELPGVLQIIGFVIAVAAIVLINWSSDRSDLRMGAGLVVLLIAGGAGDAMSKVFEVYGSSVLSSQFLFYTFLVALILCVGLVILKKERPGRNEVLFGLLIGVPNYFSARFLLLSLASVDAVIAYPTYSVATLLAVTLIGVLLFREKLSRRQWVAIGMILVALALLNI